MPTRTDTSPWFKQGWPWLLIFFPAAAVVAGFFTLYLAVSSDDGLVVDDYYEEGKAINQVIQRDKHASALKVRATLNMEGTNGLLTLRLDNIAAAHPDELSLKFVYATRAGNDHEVTLTRTLAGVYTATAPVLDQGRWNLQLADTDWRVISSMTVPGPRQATFTADK